MSVYYNHHKATSLPPSPLPPPPSPQHSIRLPQQFANTHLDSWVERGTVKVKWFAQEYNTTTQPGLKPRPLDSESSTNHWAAAWMRSNNSNHVIMELVIKLWKCHWEASTLTGTFQLPDEELYDWKFCFLLPPPPPSPCPFYICHHLLSIFATKKDFTKLIKKQ